MPQPLRPATRRAAMAFAAGILAISTAFATGSAAFADDPALPFDQAPVPTYSGVAVVGGVISAETGTWLPTPTSFTYQWSLDGTPVTGATGWRFAPTLAEQGQQLSVAITANKDGYLSQTTSSLPIPVLGRMTIGAAQIQGVPKPGDTVTATVGSVSPPDATMSYQWNAGARAIAGATDSTFSPTEDLAGGQLSVTVTASEDGYAPVSTTAYTQVTYDTIRTQPSSPFGTNQIGSTLTASSTGGWLPVPTTVRYQWLRDGTPIDGATAATYTTTPDDGGHRLSYVVTGSHIEFADASVTSSQTAPILLGFDTVTTPLITGVPEVGVALKAVIPAWTPAASSYRYYWYVGGVLDQGSAQGAGQSTFTPTGTAVGKSVTVQVTGTAINRSVAQSPMSAATSLVAPNPFVLGRVKLGTVHLNSAMRPKFTAPPAGATVSYQWMKSGKDIAGATASTYKPEGSDWDKYLTVRVSVSGPGYVEASSTSNRELVHSGHISMGTAEIVPGEDVRIGATLHAEALGWAPGTTVHFVWMTADPYHSESHSSSLRVTSADYPGELSVFAWGSAPHLGSSLPGGMLGQSYRVHPAVFSKQPVPVIVGTPEAGSKLTAHRGTWSPSSGVVFGYQWYRQVVPRSRSHTRPIPRTFCPGPRRGT